jgi:hypothetical protein
MSKADAEEWRILNCQIFGTPPVCTAKWSEADWEKWEAHQKDLRAKREAIEAKYQKAGE